MNYIQEEMLVVPQQGIILPENNSNLESFLSAIIIFSRWRAFLPVLAYIVISEGQQSPCVDITEPRWTAQSLKQFPEVNFSQMSQHIPGCAWDNVGKSLDTGLARWAEIPIGRGVAFSILLRDVRAHESDNGLLGNQSVKDPCRQKPGHIKKTTMNTDLFDAWGRERI
jgi:hypothetical protein